MFVVKFVSPNARQQAASWLRNNHFRFDEKLLSIILYDQKPYEMLCSVKDDSVLVLNHPYDASVDNHFIWTAEQAGSYGGYVAELAKFKGKFFYYQAGEERLLEEIRESIRKSAMTGQPLSPNLICREGDDVPIFFISKKRGVKSV